MRHLFSSAAALGGLVMLTLAAASPAAAAAYPKDNLPPEYVIGTSPAPPTGGGKGLIEEWRVGTKDQVDGRFGSAGSLSGNSFRASYDPGDRALYVPTAAGETYVLDRATLQPQGEFQSIPGGRIARVTPDHKTVLILSPQGLAAYSASDWQRLFRVPIGGNALAVSLSGRHAFVGGNDSDVVTEINLPSGTVAHIFPVKGSSALAWANGQLFSADMKTGIVSVIHPASGRIVRISTPEVDPAFSYRHIHRATAGLMQLAASPDQLVVYAAGFSGHILMFSAKNDRYLGEIPVHVDPAGPNRLSGLTVVNGGADAVVTAENADESALVSLADGKVLKRFAHTASNRWITVEPGPVA
ncbi:MAG: hypothetical protein P8076_04965 [Gammaproteobacteria bacterium]